MKTNFGLNLRFLNNNIKMLLDFSLFYTEYPGINLNVAKITKILDMQQKISQNVSHKWF